MSLSTFLTRHLADIRRHGLPALFRKIRQLPGHVLVGLVALPFLIVIRLIRPWFLVRFGPMINSSMGHFAGNTELYLCERDAGINLPDVPYFDIFFMSADTTCNEQLATMWRRTLRVGPRWLLLPVSRVNRLLPGAHWHEVGDNTQWDRDVHNLIDDSPPHLVFTADENARGQAGLRVMGIPPGTPFVCLMVRDSAYHQAESGVDGHDELSHRNSDVRNFALAARALAERGYYVFRMGARVWRSLEVPHPNVIDYATNGMRSDFMDVYLGANCEFCVSTSTGFDAIPLIFRRPIAQVDSVPIIWLYTFRRQFLGITKRHFSVVENRELTLREIFARGVGFLDNADTYSARGIRLIENTPDELRDLVIEMDERLRGVWRAEADDESLQRRFWEIFPVKAVDPENQGPLHGEIRSRYGAAFLRNTHAWLQ